VLGVELAAGVEVTASLDVVVAGVDVAAGVVSEPVAAASVVAGAVVASVELPGSGALIVSLPAAELVESVALAGSGVVTGSVVLAGSVVAPGSAVVAGAAVAGAAVLDAAVGLEGSVVAAGSLTSAAGVEVLVSVGPASLAIRGAFESPAAPGGAWGGPAGVIAGGGAGMVGSEDGDGPLCETAGAFATALASPLTGPEDAYDFDGVAEGPVSEYELLWTGTRIVRPGRLTRRPACEPDVRRVTERCATRVERAGVALPALGTERAAAIAAARSSFGTAIVGNRATGASTAGMSTAALEGSTIDLTVATASVRYGSDSATSPSTPNHQSCRRVARPPKRIAPPLLPLIAPAKTGRAHLFT
jgi:hypothetical protein